jgi:hypothetical protein
MLPPGRLRLASRLNISSRGPSADCSISGPGFCRFPVMLPPRRNNQLMNILPQPLRARRASTHSSAFLHRIAHRSEEIALGLSRTPARACSVDRQNPVLAMVGLSSPASGAVSNNTVLHGGPRVRIRLPPAASQQRTMQWLRRGLVGAEFRSRDGKDRRKDCEVAAFIAERPRQAEVCRRSPAR